MSDDLSMDAPASATATASAPAVTVAGFALEAPKPVPAIRQEEAVVALPVNDASLSLAEQKANAFVNALATLEPRSPEFAAKIAVIDQMATKEIRETSAVSNRMLERPMQQNSPQAPQVRVSTTLADLRHTVDDLNPATLKSPVKRFLRSMPFGDRLRDYFDGYKSAQSHLDAITRALASGQDELRKDNAAIEGEKVNLWEGMAKLREYIALADALDRGLTQRVAQLEAAGDTEGATALKSDALFPVRQKHQDLLTQIAVSMQGYLALDLVRKNNLELIKGVDRALTTTLSALRTAVIVSQALTNQRLVLTQITALNETTSNLIVQTSEMLQTQGAEINQQAASSTVEIAKLEQAFANVFETMDAIDTFKAQASEAMGQTISALEGQIVKAQPYLERAKAVEPRQVGTSSRISY